MTIKNIKIICFSPTNSTKRILQTIASGLTAESTEILDITLPNSLSIEDMKIKADLVLIGVPVYAGRVPLTAVERLQKLTAQGVPAILVAVYGNRHYDDALLELNDIAIAAGFKPIAAGTFIAEHSFATEEYPIAKSRPDAEDLTKAKQFGEEIVKKFKSTESPDLIKVPGNLPYKERGPALGIAPDTDKNLCINCMKCVSACPTSAIPTNDPTITNADKCILCCACIKVCPVEARKNTNPKLEALSKRLSENFETRLEAELFI
jgi:ferredoxin